MMHFAMDHVVLNVEDIDAMIKFYTEVLGLVPERLNLYRQRKAPFPSVRVNADTIIDLFPPEMWQGKGQKQTNAGLRDSSLNHFCVVIERNEWAHFLQRIKNYKISLLEGPVKRWGAHGTGISIYFHDPEMNTIEVRYYPNGDGESLETLAS